MNIIIRQKKFILSLLTIVAIFSFNNKSYAEENIVYERISGEDRYETSREIALNTYATADTVILANGGSYPDSISAIGLSKKYEAPIILNEKESLNSGNLSVLKKLNTKKVILIGDETSISLDVENKLIANGLEIERFAGDDRYDTSVIVNDYVYDKDSIDELIIVSGENFADSISISSYAHNKNIPLFITPKDADSDLIDKIKSFNPNKVYVAGGENVVGSWVEKNFANTERVAGEDRYDTSKKIHNKFFDNTEVVYTTKGDSFPDSITGIPLASNNDTNIVLSKNNAKELTYVEAEKIVILGERLSIDPVIKFNGWKGDKYYKEDVAVKGWQDIDGKSYFFDNNSNLVKKHTYMDGKWYLFKSNGEFMGKGKKYTSNASAYSGHSVTASGEKPKWGTIVTDPKVIPMYSKVYIPYFDKTFRANDTGGAIKGTKVDVFMNSNKEARQFGRRNIDIFVLE